MLLFAFLTTIIRLFLEQIGLRYVAKLIQSIEAIGLVFEEFFAFIGDIADKPRTSYTLFIYFFAIESFFFLLLI